MFVPTYVYTKAAENNKWQQQQAVHNIICNDFEQYEAKFVKFLAWQFAKSPSFKFWCLYIRHLISLFIPNIALIYTISIMDIKRGNCFYLTIDLHSHAQDLIIIFALGCNILSHIVLKVKSISLLGYIHIYLHYITLL